METFAIFVNTTDSFDDCWFPFFTLFKKYWPGFMGRIYLNTEHKSFSFPGLNIISIQNSRSAEDNRKTWSECLIAGLMAVEEDSILYMQEDYFLKSTVDTYTINRYAHLLENADIDCIHLTDQHSSGPFAKSDYADLWHMGRFDFHKISCQAALWKKKVLLAYVRPHENPWQFELYGTLRAQMGHHSFYTIPRTIYKEHVKEVLPYIFTGVIQGKWFEKVVDLFATNGIQVDFSRRGFISDKDRFALAPRLKRKWKDLNRKSIFELIKAPFTRAV